jgi:hypothetical protein
VSERGGEKGRRGREQLVLSLFLARARSLSHADQRQSESVSVSSVHELSVPLTHSHLSLSRSLARRQNGQTPLSIAEARHNNELAQLLREAMGLAPQGGNVQTDLEKRIREFYLKHAPE